MSAKATNKKMKRATSKDDSIAKDPDEKLKKSIYSVTTPRNYVQKPLAADIYAKKSNVQSLKAPKKVLASSNKSSNVSPMKDLLRSSPSSISQTSAKSYKIKPSESKSTLKSNAPSNASVSSKNTGVAKKLPFTNTTIAKLGLDNDDKQNKMRDKKTNDHTDKTKDKLRPEQQTEVTKRKEIVNSSVVLPERKRTKTRTLEDEEIKILTPDVVDNNLEMLNMSKKLSAHPKAFYVDLNEQKLKPPQKISVQTQDIEEEVTYDDDFESYESDFDSYHNDSLNDDTSLSNGDNDCRSTDDDGDDVCKCYDDEDYDSNILGSDESHFKEDRMLDSGNFELPDPRSAGKSKPMDYIVEGLEDTEKRVSLTDEGFQDMSGSGLSSMKTLHVDVLDRPLFIDFTKSKVNRRKRKIFERLKQRAEDILSMVTLHEMSYDLYEMKPIPYDLYMATFGRFNYTQTAVQTFDDGITEETQTDEIIMIDKWTQNPIEFSINDHYYDSKINNMNKKDSVENFEFLINNVDDDTNNIIDESYKTNPLRIYLEQKDGVSTNKMLPYENYKKKLKNVAYDPKKLRKFLKKFESKISNILNINTGNSISNLNKTSKFPFSEEYLLINNTNMTDVSYLFNTQIISVIYSDTKTNMVALVHSKLSSEFKKCFISLWDISVAILKPFKILIATDDVTIGRFRGSSSGFIIGGLCDGSIQLWDLSEEPTWFDNVAQFEARESDLHSKDERDVRTLKKHTLHASSYTSSATNICNSESADRIVGLEFMGEDTNVDDERRILAQLCVLQSIGILTVWSIIQVKTKNLKHETGKALWSKVKLERNQTINLIQHIDIPIQDFDLTNLNFNLNSARKRMVKKRNERHKSKISRPKSAIMKNKDENLSNKRSVDRDFCDHFVVCNHLKIMKHNGVENYLVAKSGGEVLCCRRDIGTVKIKAFRIAGPVSLVTCIETSPHGLPYFLAATDCGTVNMCSLMENRVLLTLDCRNGPSSVEEKCQSDSKGRYLGTISVHTGSSENIKQSKLQLPITSVAWLHPNPFCITATIDTSILVWELTHSDIKAKGKGDGVACTTNGRSLALLTKKGDVQVYKLTDSKDSCLELFQKYVSIL